MLGVRQRSPTGGGATHATCPRISDSQGTDDVTFPEWSRDVLVWLNGWIRTPGFGGAAAVMAAVLAYRGAARSRSSEDSRAREQRWWEQARWAGDLLTEDTKRQALGIAALAQLVDEADDVEAAVFAMTALDQIIDAQVVDVEQHDKADWAEEEGDDDDQERPR